MFFVFKVLFGPKDTDICATNERQTTHKIMYRYFIEMAYDGTNYHGWQIQPNAASVQQEINNALLKLFRQPEVYVVGAGRTDTGVHADYFVAHFDLAEPIDDVPRALFKFNAILPADISVYSLQLVDDKLHSRFSALSRTYHYRITTHKNPMTRLYSFRPFFPLDFERMNQAAESMLHYTDFTSFSRLHTQVKTNDCNVTCAHWIATGDDTWCFEIRANRFLRNMVRATVGTLFDVGRGKISVDDFRHIIEAKDRALASASAAPQGLSLVDIAYPEGRGFQKTRHISAY